jgi:hypothetical protein
LAILNSSVIRFYFEVKASRRGEDKFFFPNEFCEQLPIKPVKTKEERKIHDKLVLLVDEMIEERKKLLGLSSFISDKQYLNNKYYEELPELDDKRIVHSLGWGAARPIKQNDSIKYSLGTIEPENFILNKVQIVGENLFESQNSLRLIGSNGTIVEFRAELNTINLLKLLLEDYRGHSLREILEEVEIPLKTGTLESKKKEISNEIKSITKRITQLQEKIDLLVMELYDVKVLT